MSKRPHWRFVYRSLETVLVLNLTCPPRLHRCCQYNLLRDGRPRPLWAGNHYTVVVLTPNIPNKLWCRCHKKARISSNEIKANQYQNPVTPVLFATACIFGMSKMRRPTTSAPIKRRDELHGEPAGIYAPLFGLFGSVKAKSNVCH